MRNGETMTAHHFVVPPGSGNPSQAGSRIMELDSPNAPEVSATEVRDTGVSDADVLRWGRALPRSQGPKMMDLDI